MSANVLSSRDANAQVLKSSPETKDAKPKTLDYQREMLNKKLNGNKYATSPVLRCAALI
jgi:hypothetical protein